MSKRFSFIKFSSAIIFLLTTIFPTGAFSYAGAAGAKDSDERKLVDESKDAEIISFKKGKPIGCLFLVISDIQSNWHVE